MYVITFYSFKGGVGRTMALVNVAAELARRGRKILVVDFDLEAPGLETYKHLRPTTAYPGIVEYVTEFQRTHQVPDLRDYIYEAQPIGKKGGRLWVMPAGRRDRARTYRSALANLDWQRLYKEEDGFLLFEDLKKGWEEELEPDYVLIDSRTGDTDVLGICTRQLPDSVVLMFTPNEQNLAGLKNVCDDIRREETEGLKKKIRLHFVAANVPDLDDEKRILHRQLQAFRKRLRFCDLSGVIRRYENLNLLDQSIFTLDRPHTRLARSYRRLLRTLLKDNLADRDGAMIFLQDYPKRREMRVEGEQGVFSSDGSLPFPPLTSEPPGSTSPTPGVRSTLSSRIFPADLPENTSRGHLMVHLSDGRDGCCVAFWRDIYSLHQIGQFFKDDAEILNKVAGSFILEEDFKSAVQMFDRALLSNPNYADALIRRAVCKVNLGQIDAAADDLLACLRLPISVIPAECPVENLLRANFHTTALAKLHDIAPARMLDAAVLLETKGLPVVDRDLNSLVTHYLCDTEEGLPHAAQRLRASLADLDEGQAIPVGLLSDLMRARCWKEVIQLHETDKLREQTAASMLQLALAHWGQDGELPEVLCKQILEGVEHDNPFRGNWGLEAGALLFWRVGQVADALTLLEKVESKARARADDSFSTDKEGEFFSVWRLREVSIGQYLDDCKLLRRMFQGEPLRPAFLGPPR